MLVPAKPSHSSFGELVPLSEAYRVIAPEELSETVELLPYEGPYFENHESELMLFLVAHFADTNQSGAHETGEPILGLSTTLLAYFNRVGCGVWGGKFQQGWNALELRESGPAPYSLDAIDVPANLISQRDLELQLGMEPSTDSRVVLTPETAWRNQLSATPLLDTPTAESLTLVLPEEIPEDHLQSTDIAGVQYSDWYYGVELPLWIENQSAYNSFGTEGTVRSFCSQQNEAIKIGHYPEADTLEEAFHLVAEQRTPGWALYVEDSSEGWRAADPMDLGPLTDLGCSP